MSRVWLHRRLLWEKLPYRAGFRVPGDSDLSPATVDCAPLRRIGLRLEQLGFPRCRASAVRASSLATVSLLNGVNVRAASRACSRISIVSIPVITVEVGRFIG